MTVAARPTIPPHLLRSATSHRLMGQVGDGGHINCGFLLKHRREDVVDGVNRSYSAVYVLRGSGTYVDWNARHHPLHAGCLFQRLPGRRHSTLLDPTSGWAECWVDFSASIARPLIAIGVIDATRAVLEPGLDLSLARRFDRLQTTLTSAPDRDLPRFFTEMVALLVDLYALDRSQRDHDPHAAMVEQACRVLADAESPRGRLERVARSFNVGYERFRKVFRERIGVSPGEYRIRRRIDRARELLLRDRRSVKEIAFALGYANPFTFSLQFKHWVGLSPERFRRMH